MKFSFTIEDDKNIYSLETENYFNFMIELQNTLRECGEIQEDASIAVLSPSSRKILDWAGECY